MGRGKLHSCWLGRALAHGTRHPLLIQKLLHDLDDERHPCCSLTVLGTDHRKQATGWWLGRCLATVRAISGEAPALRTAPAAAVVTGGPPPSNDSAQKGSVRHVVGTSWGSNGN
jgi:hypothetical protein